MTATVQVAEKPVCHSAVGRGVSVGNSLVMMGDLLEQKEKDLELAARIGQGLLTRNKALEERLIAVEGELHSAHDTVTQLRHDLLLKGELLQIYSNDFDDSSPEGGKYKHFFSRSSCKLFCLFFSLFMPTNHLLFMKPNSAGFYN